MAKMFYTTEEAAQKLGMNVDQLKQLVTDSKLREFRDGAKVMFKVDQVDRLVDKGASGTRAGTGGPIGLSDSGIGLADSRSDVISLADSAAPASKEDTVVTGQAGGAQQVLKPGEVKAADTGAQTHIQSAVDDQLSLEGVGSGSGLLDLTRESDDTSLGAELLDEIYPGGDTKSESGIGSASGIFEQAPPTAAETSGPSGLDNIAATGAAPPVIVAPIEVNDPSSGAFGGLAFAAVVVSIVTAVIALNFFQGSTPDWVKLLTGSTMNVMIFGVILVVVSALLAGFGLFAGKAR